MLDVHKALQGSGVYLPFTLDIQLDPLQYAGDDWSFSDVHAEGSAQALSPDSLHVQGEITACIHTKCYRCLQDASMSLHIAFDEIYAKDTQDPDVFQLEGSVIDLTPMVQSNLLLEMPTRLLCMADCEGLCQSCGKRLSECSCPKQTHNHAFDALLNLFPDNE